MINIAINGYGRIGRNILRAVYESGQREHIRIVAINDMADIEMNAHLTRFDSTHGPFHGEVSVNADGDMVVNGDVIRVCSNRDPAQLPWGDLNIDVVCECTGFFTSKDKAALHLQAGAKKVLISAPGGADVDATVVYGVNHAILKASDKVVSNASCTTNCLAPIAKVLHEAFGIETGLMTTIHAFTNDQMLLDSSHSDFHRARAATLSMIPTKTGAASALGLVMAELKGKLDGYAMRVPVCNVSVVDFTFVTKTPNVTVEAVNAAVRKAAEGELSGVLAYNTLPLVSIDFNHNPASSTFDATQTKVLGQTIKVLSWYDNEWGFSNRMLDVVCALMNAR